MEGKGLNDIETEVVSEYVRLLTVDGLFVLDFVVCELCVYVTDVVLVTPVGKAVMLVVGVCNRLVDTLKVTLCVLILVCEGDALFDRVLEFVVLDVKVLVCLKLWV